MSCLEIKSQCCANTLSNTRCINSAIPGCDHCQLHHEKAKSLYMKYKGLSDLIDKMVLDKEFDNIQEKIDYIMNCYILLNKTFNARSKHHKYAYVPECIDEGHKFQFTRLKAL